MIIPNYIDMQVIDPKTGYFTPQWKAIMQQLMQELQLNASQNGLVAPTQDSATITTIETATQVSPAPPGFTFITSFGTLLYNSTGNILMVALNNAGAPQFHQIVTL